MDIEFGYFVWDAKHNESESRMFCIGKVENKIVTVRYVKRDARIRIIGAGYWRQGRKYYHGA